jgi:hypothetical protein
MGTTNLSRSDGTASERGNEKGERCTLKVLELHPNETMELAMFITPKHLRKGD